MRSSAWFSCGRDSLGRPRHRFGDLQDELPVRREILGRLRVQCCDGLPKRCHRALLDLLRRGCHSKRPVVPGRQVTDENAVGIGVYGTATSGMGVYGRHAGSTGTGPGVESASAAGTVLGYNSAGGPGRQARVSSNSIPPLKVNSSAQVANLNASLLGGHPAAMPYPDLHRPKAGSPSG
jgi:hypothetical protein